MVPDSIEGTDPEILDPINTWDDKKAYHDRVKKLTQEFSDHFDKVYGNAVDESIRNACPGK